ncbi:MAG TPA: hypothetical protein VJ180_16325 [Pyrinomonadaceae bacterium]|nr:hypothetical protein [Pyrinomonadaceae bacterium]
MKIHQWLLNVSSVVLTIAFSGTPTLAQMSTLLPESSQRSCVGSADVTQSLDQGEASRLVADPDAEKYKLVFPRGPVIDEFFEQLNKAGEQRYNLLSVMYRWRRLSTLNGYRAPVAILKLDQVQHEYAWFKTKSKSYFTINGFERKYRKLSEQGFHLVDFLVDVDCASTTLEGDCNYEYDQLFLFEREKGVEKPLQFIVARSIPQRKLKMGAELTEQIKAKLADGFYPINVFNKFEILLTQMEHNDKLSTGNPDVQVVTLSVLHDVKGKIKNLAKQGYRLLQVSSGIAVMYRRADSSRPVSYEWVDADKSDFEKRLLELQGRGAVYRMIYPNRDRTSKEKLIFELGAADERVRREYKVLRFEFQDGKDAAGNPVQVDLTPSSKETVKLMNNLANEGFVVRELFKSKKVSVLLERSR